MDDLDTNRTQLTEYWLNLKSVERFFNVKFEKELCDVDKNLNFFKVSACHYMRSFLDIFHENVFHIYLKYFNSEIDLDFKIEEFTEEVISATNVEEVFFALDHFRDNLKIYHNRSVLELRNEIEKVVESNLIPVYYEILNTEL